jgi:hypothetical protein
MPNAIAPIFESTWITKAGGPITEFFRLRWEEIRTALSRTPTVAGEPDLAKTNQSAAIATATLYTTVAGALYRVSYALLRTIDDGVSSSLTVTIGWTQNGVPKTATFAALTEAAGLSEQSLTKPIYCDGATNITIAVAYASNTPAKMHFDLHAAVEQLA